MKYDLSKPKNQRVVSLSVLCTDCRVPKYEPLELEKIYTVVMPSYIVDGGDGFGMIKKGLLRHNTGRTYSLEEVAAVNHRLNIKWPTFSMWSRWESFLCTCSVMDVLQLERLSKVLMSLQEHRKEEIWKKQM